MQAKYSGINVTTRIAIIPARGGSKRIANKNIIDFCGKPMIQYVLEAAKESNLFDKIHVSTDDEKIAEVVIEAGFEVDFYRPGQLADDETPLMPVLKYVVDTYEKRGKIFDQVCLIMATNPLIDSNDINAMVKVFEKNNSKSPVLGIVEYPAPIEWAFEYFPHGKLNPLQPGMFATRSQDLTERYYDAGCIAIYSNSFVTASEGAGDDMNYLGYKLPKYKGIDIDTLEDLQFAKIIYKGIKSGEI